MKNKITIDEKASSIVNITNIIKYSNKLINNCIKFLLSPPSILLQSLQGTSPISPLGNCQVRLSSFPGTQSITETQSRNNRDWHKITGNNTSKKTLDLARGDASRDFSREEKQKERMSEIFSLAEGKDSRIACGPLVRVIRERWACIFAHFIPEEEEGRRAEGDLPRYATRRRWDLRPTVWSPPWQRNFNYNEVGLKRPWPDVTRLPNHPWKGFACSFFRRHVKIPSHLNN